MTDHFVLWAKKRGIYDKFKAVEKRNRELDSFDGNYYDIINHSFTWRYTVEGEEYWTKIHREWNDEFLTLERLYAIG